MFLTIIHYNLSCTEQQQVLIKRNVKCIQPVFIKQCAG
jgi:hypothetical protein